MMNNMKIHKYNREHRDRITCCCGKLSDVNTVGHLTLVTGFGLLLLAFGTLWRVQFSKFTL